MAGYSDYAEDKLLNHLFADPVWDTSAEERWVALFNGVPLDNGTGTEVSVHNYSRVQVTGSDWGAPFWADGRGKKQNTSAITFPQASGGNWGTIQGFAIFDASVGGNMIVNGLFSPSVTVLNNETATFLAGDLTVEQTVGGAEDTAALRNSAFRMLDHVLNDGQWDTSLESRYVGLWTGTTDATEVAGNNYSRVQVTSGEFNAAASGLKRNNQTILFPQATPSGWGLMQRAAIYDAATDGNLIVAGAFTPTITVNTLDKLAILSTDLFVSLD